MREFQSKDTETPVRCCVCGKTKPFKDMQVTAKKGDWRMDRCKACHSKYVITRQGAAKTRKKAEVGKP